MTTRRTIDVDGISTSYLEAGSGTPILLIHGGDFRSPSHSADWDSVIPLLAQQGYRVIAVDKLGQGFTAAPADDADLTMRATCQHVTRFVHAMQLDRFHVAGHSRGAMPAMLLAMEEPGSIISVTLVDSATIAVERDANAAQFYRDAFAKLDAGSQEDAEIAKELYMNSYATDHISVEILAARREAALTDTAKSIRQRLSSPELATAMYADIEQMRTDVLDAIEAGSLRKRVLVVWGANDPSAPLAGGVKLFEHIRAHNQEQTDLCVLDRSGHYPYRERPEMFAEVMGGALALAEVASSA